MFKNNKINYVIVDLRLHIENNLHSANLSCSPAHVLGETKVNKPVAWQQLDVFIYLRIKKMLGWFEMIER